MTPNGESDQANTELAAPAQRPVRKIRTAHVFGHEDLGGLEGVVEAARATETEAVPIVLQVDFLWAEMHQHRNRNPISADLRLVSIHAEAAAIDEISKINAAPATPFTSNNVPARSTTSLAAGNTLFRHKDVGTGAEHPLRPAIGQVSAYAGCREICDHGAPPRRPVSMGERFHRLHGIDESQLLAAELLWEQEPVQ